MASFETSIGAQASGNRFHQVPSSSSFTSSNDIVSRKDSLLFRSEQTRVDVGQLMPPAKRPRLSSSTSAPGQDEHANAGFNDVAAAIPESNRCPDILERGSRSTESASRDFDIDTSYSTPNDSTTSVSLMSNYFQVKSTSPASALRDVTPSSAVKPAQAKPRYQTGYGRYRPRSSIPAKLSAVAYAQQCIAAAYASRLDPYALHKDEQELLQDNLCHIHVTAYLNVRNGILRLWTRNPMVSVTKEEGLGCAKDYRWMNLASVAYEWLVRNGYINFGCVEMPMGLVPPKKGRRKEGPIIVVVGAGMAGLGCARHLEGLFRHYKDTSHLPRVVVLEGRRRIGGRIYSHPLRSLQSRTLPFGLVPKADMGAQIVVGFEHGNPLDQIIRGQLGLAYHMLRDLSTIYDIDGSPVDEAQDVMDERLYNDVLDRSGVYRHKSIIVSTAEGDRELIDSGRESSLDDGLTIRQYEEARAAGTIGLLLPTKRVRRGVGHKTADIRPNQALNAEIAPNVQPPAALACLNMGWSLNQGVSVNDSLDLDSIAKSSNMPSLGAVMDESIKQFQHMLPLTPKDMRLLNWHFANLEYANAANVGKLSLSGWDQDMGNEFEGEHSQIIGGYQQVPYGLFTWPTKLDVRTNKIVTKITYDASGMGNRRAIVHCEDGERFHADRVVLTAPLGVLKQQSIRFEPPLPEWKTGAIERLGFGIMNKVILVFDRPFWDTERDMFGLLREPINKDSMAQGDYSFNRGRFYLFWNCVKTTGLPVLIALMVGDAAHQAECMRDAEIIQDVTAQLRNIFKKVAVPDPLETIITRWRSDRFTRGSYSFVAAEALPGDYDLMAESVGNLHFAGEATCGTHPATVHGAYLSGLRAASEVIESIVGPIEIPYPLVPEKGKTTEFSSPSVAGPMKNDARSFSSQPAESVPVTTAPTAKPLPLARSNNSFPSDGDLRKAYEQAMWDAILAELGPPEPRPAKTGLNPFLFYQKDYWIKCKNQCDEAHRLATNDPNAKAPRDEIRHALGQMWRVASEEEKRPYIEQTEVNRRTNAETWDRWKRSVAEWEKKTFEVKDRWCAANPFEKWQPGSSAKKHDAVS